MQYIISQIKVAFEITGEKTQRNEIFEYPTMEFNYREIGTGFFVELKYKDQKTTSKVGEKVGEKLTANQKKIIELIRADKHVSIPVMSEHIGIATKNIEYNIKKLKKANIIKRVGPTKGGYWEIVDTNH